MPVDHRADIFAVGILLWELFTGRRLFFGETDYQTVELVRQAKVPSLAAHNPEIEAELEGVVRKALAKDPDDRYSSAADLAEALAQYLFSRRMKVTARDISTLVKDTQVEMMRKRSAEPKDSLIDALIQDEMAKVKSLVDEESDSGTNEGSLSLDPKSFVDTSAWANEVAAPAAGRKRNTRAPGRGPAPQAQQRAATPAQPATNGAELVSLEAMLEPDRTGVSAKSAGGSPAIIPLIIAAVVLTAVIAVVVAFVL